MTSWEWRVFLVVFGLVFLALNSPTELICQRNGLDGQVDCRSQVMLFGQFPQTPRTIFDVRGASVADSYMHSDYGSGPVHRVEFNTGAGDIPLSEVWSSDRGPKEHVAEAVTRFLAERDPGELVVSQSEAETALEHGVPVAMVGGGLLAMVWPVLRRLRARQVRDAGS